MYADQQTADQYLRTHHLHVYLADLLRLLVGSTASDAVRLASNYLSAIADGEHLQGREFSYVAATPWNRAIFLHTAEAALEPLARHVDAFTLQDMHSLMLMLCSDIPLRITRSAFKAGSPLLPSGSAVPHLSGEAAKLAFPKLWNSLSVTFLFEHFLLELRHIAFEGKSHLLKGAEDVRACLEVVQAAVSSSGWPSIPETVMSVVVQEVAASHPQDDLRFHFDALVRGLCSSSDMSQHVHKTLSAVQNKQKQAATAIASLADSIEQPLLDTTNKRLRCQIPQLRPVDLRDVVGVCVEHVE